MQLINQWKKHREHLGKQKKVWRKALRKKKGKRLDEEATETHQTVFQELDCLDCANCCTSIPPIVNKTDAARLAKHLGMKTKEFEATYLTKDEDGDQVMNASPCPFLLENNECLVYEYRPKACRRYPHTDQDFSKHLGLHLRNTQYCPAVYHILERLAATNH